MSHCNMVLLNLIPSPRTEDRLRQNDMGSFFFNMIMQQLHIQVPNNDESAEIEILNRFQKKKKKAQPKKILRYFHLASNSRP